MNPRIVVKIAVVPPMSRPTRRPMSVRPTIAAASSHGVALLCLAASS